MAPIQKKPKKKTKKKHKQVSLVVPVEPKTNEVDWKESFWHKNSTAPGLVSSLFSSFFHFPSNFQSLFSAMLLF
jgi:hypothetical protein